MRFFNKSTKRSNLLKKVADRRLPGVSDTRWHYHSRIINVIFNSKLDLVETFNLILNNPQEWDGDALSTDENLLQKLEDMEFSFLLHTFSEIFSKTDILFALVQNKQVDVEVAMREIQSFELWMTVQFINKFDTIFESVQNCNDNPRKRRRNNSNTDLKTSYRRLFIEIKDNIIRKD